jgi:ribosomal protein S18 acetylase RimI-like enzyme
VVVIVRPAVEADRPLVDVFLEARNADVVARLGELVAARSCPAILGEEGDQLAGVLTYVVTGDAFEILTLHAARSRHGVGTALLTEAERIAVAHGCRRLWLITTNDNIDAIRFYQRRGYQLTKVHRGAVDRSRATLKPQIPSIGAYGIPLRDEIELERLL